MSNSESFTIRTDKATTADLFSLETYRDTLVEIIREAETPITIGIFGSWGAGKTSLLLMLEENLKDEVKYTVN